MLDTTLSLPDVTVGIGLDTGRLRADKINEDNIGSHHDLPSSQVDLPRKGLLFVVADGMGGTAGGHEASRIAVNTTLTSYYRNPLTDHEQAILQALQEANGEIYGRSRSESALRGMGTTVVTALIKGNQLLVANAGDSRCYLIRDDRLQQLSIDHSWVAQQVRQGHLTPDEAERHPQRNLLTRNLGSEAQARPATTTVTLQEEDIVVLCSDGLWNMVREEEIIQLAGQEKSDAAAEALVARANERGGPDNIAVILLRIERLPS